MNSLEVFAPRCERRALRLLAAVSAAWSLAGCTMSIPGFIDPAPVGAVKSPNYPFANEDWAKAEPAVLAAIRGEPGDEPSPWTNADSGRHGAVAGIGARFTRGGATCRAFVARISEQESAKEVQGAACEKAGRVTLSDAGPYKGV